MNIWHKKIVSFLKDENAQAMVEYVLVISMLTLIIIGMTRLFLESWKIRFKNQTNIRSGYLGVLP